MDADWDSEMGRNSKVLVMISERTLFARIRAELEKYNVYVEESLSMLPECRFVITDDFYFQWTFADGMPEGEAEKPVLLVLTPQQMREGNIRPGSRVREVLLLRDCGASIGGDLVCARREELTVQCVFENYLTETPEAVSATL